MLLTTEWNEVNAYVTTGETDTTVYARRTTIDEDGKSNHKINRMLVCYMMYGEVHVVAVDDVLEIADSTVYPVCEDLGDEVVIGLNVKRASDNSLIEVGWDSNGDERCGHPDMTFLLAEVSDVNDAYGEVFDLYDLA